MPEKTRQTLTASLAPTVLANTSSLLLVHSALLFLTQDLDNDGAGTERQFEFETPTRYSGHQCPIYDAWGTLGYNDTNYDALGGACTPSKAFSQTAYQLSHPDEWKYDINNLEQLGTSQRLR